MGPYENDSIQKWYYTEKIPFTNVKEFKSLDDSVSNNLNYYLDRTDLSWNHIEMVPYRNDRNGTIQNEKIYKNGPIYKWHHIKIVPYINNIMYNI